MSSFSIYLTSVHTWPFLIPVAACRALIGLALLVAGRCLSGRVLHVVDIKWRLIALRGRTFIGRTQRSHIDGGLLLLPFLLLGGAATVSVENCVDNADYGSPFRLRQLTGPSR